MINKDFSKQFFTQSWGPDGYYENFSYGVGIDKVCEVALYPFINTITRVLEIGSGGGVFTKRIIPRVDDLICIDVIPKPQALNGVQYIELGNQDYYCTGVNDDSIEFAFSYNCFCHLSNEAIREYLKSVNRVLRKGKSFVFMLSRYG